MCTRVCPYQHTVPVPSSPEYLLEVDPQKRPDIFQVAHVVFAMKGERNLVPNIFVSGCMWVGVSACGCACGCVSMWVCIYVCVHVGVSACVYAYMCVCIWMHAFMYAVPFPSPPLQHSPIPSQLPLPPTETESKQTAAPTKKK